MIKYLITFMFTTVTIFAEVHFAKLEPLSTIIIKSEVNGKVLVSKQNLEGKVVNSLIVKIDDKIDREDLKNSKASLRIIAEMIKVNKAVLPYLKKNVNKKYSLYKKVAPLSSSSISQKDGLFAAYVSAKSQYNATLEKVLNLENQKVNIKQKVAILKDRIAKKSISVNNRYLYSLNVKEGEFVNIGMPIATLSDIRKAKLTLYLSKDELINIDNKSIYINDKKTNLKPSKIWKVADKKYISSYKVEVTLEPTDKFSTLMKVEIK